MTAQKDRITAELLKIGACWAVSSDKFCSPDDPLEDQAAGRATYHIHPDRTEPRAEYIQRFDSLRELEDWIREQRPLRRRPEAQRGDKRTNVYLSPEDRALLRRCYGSVQAAIEQLVERELKAADKTYT